MTGHSVNCILSLKTGVPLITLSFESYPLPADGAVKEMNAEHDGVDNLCFLLCFLNPSSLIIRYNTS